VVEVCFCWGFSELGTEKRGFVQDKCGANVVVCVAEVTIKRVQKNRTDFSDLFFL
jgi:hypothetical protein